MDFCEVVPRFAISEFRVPFQLEFPEVTIEAVKVIGTCKASTPNQLITYFDESHIDLKHAVHAEDQKQEVDIKVQASVCIDAPLNRDGPYPEFISMCSFCEPGGVTRTYWSSVRPDFCLDSSKSIKLFL